MIGSPRQTLLMLSHKKILKDFFHLRVSLCCGEEGLFHGKTSIIKRLFLFFTLPFSRFHGKGRTDGSTRTVLGSNLKQSSSVKLFQFVCGN